MRLEAHDPSILALVPSNMIGSWQTKEAKVFRRSKLAEMREKYGEEMEVIVGDE